MQRIGVERRRIETEAAQGAAAQVQATDRGSDAGLCEGHRWEMGLLLCDAGILARELGIQQ
jgi:hypothetical protein